MMPMTRSRQRSMEHAKRQSRHYLYRTRQTVLLLLLLTLAFRRPAKDGHSSPIPRRINLYENITSKATVGPRDTLPPSLVPSTFVETHTVRASDTICSGLLANKKQPKKPVEIRLESENARFLHHGKAGGGTFRSRLRRHWNLYIDQCHPYPCNITEGFSNGSNSKSNKSAIVLFSIRDPIERFVSAFYWRSHVLCNPTGDERNHTTERRGVDSEKYCRSSWEPTEQYILFQKYKQNVSVLAESLCEHDATFSNAKQDMAKIGHMRHSISDWLVECGWWKKEMKESFAPIVLEPNFDFERQIDEAVHWVLHDRTGIETADLASRQSYVQLQDCKDISQHKQHKGTRHSSVIRSPLSEQGTKCLANFYRKDYEIIREMTGWCKTEDCQLALRSILDRRRHLLAGNPGW